LFFSRYSYRVKTAPFEGSHLKTLGAKTFYIGKKCVKWPTKDAAMLVTWQICNKQQTIQQCVRLDLMNQNYLKF